MYNLNKKIIMILEKIAFKTKANIYNILFKYYNSSNEIDLLEEYIQKHPIVYHYQKMAMIDYLQKVKQLSSYASTKIVNEFIESKNIKINYNYKKNG